MRNLTKSRTIGNHILTAEVSPCIWMYQGHPFQIKVDMGDKENRQSGGCVYLQDKALNNDTYTEMDIVRLLGTVKIQKCKNPKCNNEAFHPDHESNRKGECEHCFMTKWQAGWDAMQKKEQAKIARQDKKMKTKGMVARVEAWIHPKAGGDDYMVDIYYSSQPSKAEIESQLRQKGSAVLNDYRVVTL
jgi:hypothetical protein